VVPKKPKGTDLGQEKSKLSAKNAVASSIQTSPKYGVTVGFGISPNHAYLHGAQYVPKQARGLSPPVGILTLP